MAGREADAYAEIERKTGFRVPDLYRRMRADGVCDYGASQSEWQATWLQRSLTNPPALLGALDFEWISVDAMVAWEAPDYWRPECRFVPFAQTGAGDDYAWYPAISEGEAVPVVLAYHDQNLCEVMAPHLEGFIYLQALRGLAFADAESDKRMGLTPAQIRQSRRADVGVLRPYLRPAWIADLEAIVDRLPHRWRYKLPASETEHFSQLSDDELKERISRELAFPHLNKTFEHMQP
jgi:hypothetical protein